MLHICLKLFIIFINLCNIILLIFPHVILQKIFKFLKHECIFYIYYMYLILTENNSISSRNILV